MGETGSCSDYFADKSLSSQSYGFSSSRMNVTAGT